MTQTAHAALQTVASLSGDFAVGVAGTLVEFVLTLFLLFYLLLDGRSIVRHLARLVPVESERRDALINNLIAVMRAVVYGTTMTALLQGVLIGIGFAIIGLPSPVVFGALAAAAAFIPVVGTATVLVPAILYLLVMGRWGAAIFLLVWSGLLALGEQLIRPMLDLPPRRGFRPGGVCRGDRRRQRLWLHGLRDRARADQPGGGNRPVRQRRPAAQALSGRAWYRMRIPWICLPSSIR